HSEETALPVRMRSSPVSLSRAKMLPIVPMLLGGALRLWHLGWPSLWMDEGTSAAIATLPVVDFVKVLWRRDANMSAYYLLLRLWMLAGHSDLWIRLLSALLSTATIPVLFVLARRMFSTQVALIASGVLALNPMQV